MATHVVLKKPWWKRRAGRISASLSTLLGFLYVLEKWVGIALLPEGLKTIYENSKGIIDAISPHTQGVLFGAIGALAATFTLIYITEKWGSIRSMVLMLPWALRYVRITAIGKVPVYYRFVVQTGTRTRQRPSVKRIRKGRVADIRFDIPEGVHQYFPVIEVPATYKLLFPNSDTRTTNPWRETIASNGRRRYKLEFVVARWNASSWIRVQVVTRYGEAGWEDVWEQIGKTRSLRTLGCLGHSIEKIVPAPPTFDELMEQLQKDEG